MSIAIAPPPLASKHGRAAADLPEPPLRYQRMSLAEYLTIPEGPPFVEWADGWAIFMSVPKRLHGRAVARLSAILLAALPNCDVVSDAGLALATSRRIPDIAVFNYQDNGDENWNKEVPLIAVEILSPSTRNQDLVDKRDEYARAGIYQYWIVDPVEQQVSILKNSNGNWQTLAVLADQNPTATVDVADRGTVHLNLHQILG